MGGGATDKLGEGNFFCTPTKIVDRYGHTHVVCKHFTKNPWKKTQNLRISPSKKVKITKLHWFFVHHIVWGNKLVQFLVFLDDWNDGGFGGQDDWLDDEGGWRMTMAGQAYAGDPGRFFSEDEFFAIHVGPWRGNKCHTSKFRSFWDQFACWKPTGTLRWGRDPTTRKGSTAKTNSDPSKEWKNAQGFFQEKKNGFLFQHMIEKRYTPWN